MPTHWQKSIAKLATNLSNFLLTTVVIGGIQVTAALLVWPILFRTQPAGFSMALSLIGFVSWLAGAGLSFGVGRRAARTNPADSRLFTALPPNPVTARVQTQLERSGCGLTLFVSSLIPLTLAFVLRVQADMRTGKTWSDIFPTMP